MKYTPKEIAETEFNLRRTAPRLKADMINDLGSVEITSDPSSNEITWNAIPGFNRYRIQITRQSDGELVVNRTVTATSFTPDFDATTGHDRQVFTARRIPQTDTITGTSITPSTATVEEGSTLELTGSVQGIGSYNTSGTWTRESGDAIPFTTDGNTITISPGATDAGQQAVFRFTSDGDNNEFSERTITVTEESSYTPQNSRAGDEAFMQAFYDSTNGGSWHNNTGWVDGDMDLSRANIAGVTVDTVGGELRIVNFDMAKEITDDGDTGAYGGNGIEGELCPEWGNLTKCINFNIKQNSFTGSIPDTLQSGCLLERISLGGQKGELDMTWRSEWYEENHRGRFFREIISTGGKRVESTNNFLSDLPSTISNCPNIDLIEIRHQSITGSLPASWGGVNPRGIFINNSQASSDKLGGTLPSEWGSMDNLIFFSIEVGMGEGTFSGEIPTEIDEGWTNIANVQVVNQNFTGSIPRFLNARDKRHMAFQRNGFTGGFPDEYFNGDNAYISAIKLVGNPLGGTIRQTVPQATYPETRNYSTGTIRLDHCGMGGEFPTWIQELSNFTQFQILGNNFTGGFPVTAAENPNMRLFWISGNNFDGDLLDADWTTSSILSILSESNEFTGNIPASWESIVTNNLDGGVYDGRLWRFQFAGNDMSGPIPDWLADINTLAYVTFTNNRLTYSDILPHYSALLSTVEAGATARNRDPILTFDNQKPFFVDQSVYNQSVGTTVTVDLSAFDYTNNVYQWFKGDTEVSGATSHTLTISNAQTSDSGTYSLRITNDDLSDDPTHNKVTGLDESYSEEIIINIT